MTNSSIWADRPLGDFLETSQGIKRGPWGGSIKKVYFVSNGYKVYEQGNVINNDFVLGNYFVNEEKFNELKDFEIKSGDILVTGAGTIGRLAVVPGNIKPGLMNQALLRIRINQIKINKKYFVYFFQLLTSSLNKKYTKGSGLKNLVAVKELKIINIPTPIINDKPDVLEQKRIADKIEKLFGEIDKAIEKTRFADQKALKLYKSVVINFYNQAVNNKSFVLMPIIKILSLINGKAFKPSEWSNKGIPIIRIQNLNNFDLPFNYCDFEIPKKYVVNNGELLISWSGTPGTSFGAFIWNRGKAVVNQHIFRSEPMIENLSVNYLAHIIGAKLQEMISKSHGGVGLKHITKSELDKVELPIPFTSGHPDISAQNKAVIMFDDVKNRTNNLVNKYKQQARELDLLKQSILNQAFQGKL